MKGGLQRPLSEAHGAMQCGHALLHPPEASIDCFLTLPQPAVFVGPAALYKAETGRLSRAHCAHDMRPVNVETSGEGYSFSSPGVSLLMLGCCSAGAG